MNYKKSLTAAALITGASMIGLAPMTVHAQKHQVNINVDMPAAKAAMKNGKWEKAHFLLKGVTEAFAARGVTVFGAKFGTIYYDQGYTELKLGRKAKRQGPKSMKKAAEYFRMAQNSFSKCREIPDVSKGNFYYNKCLLYKGQATQELEKYQEAINAYLEFDKARNSKARYDIGLYHINLAICYFKLAKPDFENGKKHFEIALQNKDRYNVAEAAVVTAFKDFAAAAIQASKDKEIVAFVNKNRSAITLNPVKMYQFTPFFLKYGAQANSKNMIEAALTLYSLMPGTVEVKEDMDFHKKNLIGYVEPIIQDKLINRNDRLILSQFKLDAERVNSSAKAGQSHELLALLTLASTLELDGYVRGAFGAYMQLELYYREAKMRDDNLYNLVRTSSLVNEVALTEKFGRRYLKDFPKGKYLNQVKNMMLISLFYSGEYEIALGIATDFLEGKGSIKPLEENTKEHDLSLHVKGGSLHYLGKYFEAQPYLEKHVKVYPKSSHIIASRYFEASNYSRMQDWAKAGPKLDKFLADYPDADKNIYIPYALYDRAVTQSALDEDDLALEKLDRLENEFKGANVDAQAFVLRGDVLRKSGDIKKSKEYYLKALKAAESKNNKMIQAESLYKLVTLLGAETTDKAGNTLIKEAVPFYDKFWKNFQDSAYKTQVAVVGLPALNAVNRDEEALRNIQSVISELAQKEQSPGMEAAINTYSKYYLESGKSPQELRAHFENFPDIDPSQKTAQALLRIAIIGVYETLEAEAIKEKKTALANKHRATIKAMFLDLDERYKPSEMSDYILLRLGDFIGKTKTPTEGLKYYDQILENKRPKFRTRAIFGRATILAQSKNPDDQAKALVTLNEVIENKEKTYDKETQDQATFLVIELYARQKKWEKVIELARQYGQNGFRSKKAEVSYYLALGYDKNKDHLKALTAYNAVYSSYRRSSWEIAVPSLLRASELGWLHGKEVRGKNGKQIAYDNAAGFLKISADSFKKKKLDMSSELVETYEKLQALVKKWERSGEITPLAKSGK